MKGLEVERRMQGMLVAAATSLGLSLSASPALASLPETVTLSTFAPTGAFSAPATTSTPLAAGGHYVADVQGTMSLWKSEQWTDRKFRTCGQPETGPVFPSTKATGPAGIDAEYRFGVLTSARVCPDMPLRLPNFQMSAGGAYGHPAPLASSVAANHRYQYPLLGTGAPASFRFEDPAGKDNYGDFRITVRDAIAADVPRRGSGHGRGVARPSGDPRQARRFARRRRQRGGGSYVQLAPLIQHPDPRARESQDPLRKGLRRRQEGRRQPTFQRRPSQRPRDPPPPAQGHVHGQDPGHIP
jgi:hypothetical protein